MSKTPEIVARARVTLTLEVDVDSSWGASCTMEQIYSQAGESAIGKIRNALMRQEVRGVSITDAKATAILTERKAP